MLITGISLQSVAQSKILCKKNMWPDLYISTLAIGAQIDGFDYQKREQIR